MSKSKAIKHKIGFFEPRKKVFRDPVKSGHFGGKVPKADRERIIKQLGE